MLAINCAAQKYEWGRPCHSSEVAKLAEANGTDIDSAAPYAELWMGTHSNGPAKVASNGQLLSEWIGQHPASLGDLSPVQFGQCLPFLFKVLSVNKALSIQSHPDKTLAQQLHREYPKMYADDNHKPEMALAISDDFEALCGFAPLPDILARLNCHPELAGLVGEGPINELSSALSLGNDSTQKQALRTAFTALMTASPAAVQAAVSGLITRLSSVPVDQLQPHDALAIRLDKQYPGGDVGVLSAYFLNLVHLTSGQALYLGANEPHAYLAGELVECMATSDNVIRAGLTPKFKHAEVLCSSLTYNTGVPEILEGAVTRTGAAGSSVRVYRGGADEFEIRHVIQGTFTEADDGPAGLVLGPDPGPQLLLVQSGSGTASAFGSVSGEGLSDTVQLSRGSVLFVPANTTIKITGCREKLSCWFAAVNAECLARIEAEQPMKLVAAGGVVLLQTNLPSPKHDAAVPSTTAEVAV